MSAEPPRCKAKTCTERPPLRDIGGLLRCPWCGWVKVEKPKYDDATFVSAAMDPDACDKCCFEFEGDQCCDAADDGDKCADGHDGWYVATETKVAP